MRVGVVIPTRGDRAQFISIAKHLLSLQKRQPDIICIVDYTPKNDAVDLVERYRYGMNLLFKQGCDVVLCMEDDDYYCPNYIEKMISHYRGEDIFGCNYTIYYNINIAKYVRLEHPGRASMMNTLISRNGFEQINWDITNPFLDIHLWKILKGNAIKLPLISLGIKHGIGKSIGIGHRKGNIFKINDEKMLFLKSFLKSDDKTFNFYNGIFNQHRGLVTS